MPSPFPGMDPYLEHPEFFPELHSSLIFCLKESLQELLPEPYYTDTGSRVWIEFVEPLAAPDVIVHRGASSFRAQTAKEVAPAEGTIGYVIVPVAQETRSEGFLEI